MLRGAASWIGFVLLQQLSLRGDTVITDALSGEKQDWVGRNANIQMINENEWDSRQLAAKATLLFYCTDDRKLLDLAFSKAANKQMQVIGILHEKEWVPDLEEYASQWICHPDLYGPWQPETHPLSKPFLTKNNSEEIPYAPRTSSIMYINDAVQWIVDHEERESHIQLVNQHNQTWKESLHCSFIQAEDTRLDGFKKVQLQSQTTLTEGIEATEKWLQWIANQRK